MPIQRAERDGAGTASGLAIFVDTFLCFSPSSWNEILLAARFLVRGEDGAGVVEDGRYT